MYFPSPRLSFALQTAVFLILETVASHLAIINDLEKAEINYVL